MKIIKVDEKLKKKPNSVFTYYNLIQIKSADGWVTLENIPSQVFTPVSKILIQIG